MSTPSRRLRLLAFLFLVPLGLMLYALLQDGRVHWALSDEQQMRDWIVAAVKDPAHLLPIHHRLTGGHVGAESIVPYMQKEIARIVQDHGWLTLRGGLAHLAELCALAAALTGVVLLTKLKYDALRSMRSQDYMLQHLTKAWRRVTQLIFLDVALLVAGISLCLLYEMAWAYSHWDRGGAMALLFTLPLWGVLTGGVLALRSIRKRLTPLEVPAIGLLGRELPREHAPGLWRWVDGIARKANVPSPDHIVVGVDRSWFVTSSPVFLQSAQAPLLGHTLYIPLTYASAMSQDEAAAVMGHELGHFASGDTKKGSQLSSLFHSVRSRIHTLLEDNDSDTLLVGPGIWVSLYFLEQFDHAFHHWSRRQELAADEVGASVAGARMFAIALLRVCALSELIDLLLASPQTGNIVQALNSHLGQHALPLSSHTLEHRVEHPFDTHPPTLQRVHNLKVALDDDLLRQASRPASDADSQWFNQLLTETTHAA
ncbi:M48 family metallopeptidase [Pseudomonas sp. GD03842]|uniref:M48 family metallopeptidase n=1 Tax=Pseudomonas sp. GD03842 TaxID=2975385 RepID=UPI00244A2080|nr:M48 family metallopeptidase [Pseudomonas sp. GD03842]MDH0748792.1 M48 family metallopeptidase [Pseudomonas sp. GD03842]